MRCSQTAIESMQAWRCFEVVVSSYQVCRSLVVCEPVTDLYMVGGLDVEYDMGNRERDKGGSWSIAVEMDASAVAEPPLQQGSLTLHVHRQILVPSVIRAAMEPSRMGFLFE